MVVLILNYNNNNKFLFFKKNLKQTILLFVAFYDLVPILFSPTKLFF